MRNENSKKRDDSIVLSAPRPGSRRPNVFEVNSGQVVELKRIGN